MAPDVVCWERNFSMLVGWAVSISCFQVVYLEFLGLFLGVGAAVDASVKVHNRNLPV